MHFQVRCFLHNFSARHSFPFCISATRIQKQRAIQSRLCIIAHRKQCFTDSFKPNMRHFLYKRCLHTIAKQTSEFQKTFELETQSKKVFHHQDSLQLNRELSWRILSRLPLTSSNQKGFKIQQGEYKQSFTANKNWPNSLQNKARQQQSQLQMLKWPLYSNVELLSLWSYEPFWPERLSNNILFPLRLPMHISTSDSPIV